ncbi:hypothetical protein BCV70DRAFT_212786 [Testicularia cyperi]|uniref:DUF431-domain-containing protein n=1 Tax=Testicularia cyperi TaxID=1882483 RepID=A0A317XM71_9BASI|nr:hypothetical protein BCV70DRAFT_212786 [Testicularia cyperi]
MQRANKRPEYVIEHMEEDDPDAPSVFPEWALLEYRHMLQLVGPGSVVHFTSLSKASLESLRQSLSSTASSQDKPQSDFELHTASITTLMEQRNVSKSRVCLLDPKSPYAVSITDAGNFSSSSKDSDAHGPFAFFLFGGILGDDPPRDRTSSLRQLGFPSRHLGGIQMTTDTALGVTKRCVEDGFRLDLQDTQEQENKWGDVSNSEKVLGWVDHPELNFGKGESVEMPFRYLVDEARTAAAGGAKQPLMPTGMRELIQKDLGRSFEF